MSNFHEDSCYPGKFSVTNYKNCKDFVCDNVQSGIVNDHNCICFPIICSIGIVFDIITCTPLTVYSSYKKCKKCTKCGDHKNKVSVSIIKQPRLNDSLPSYEFAINNMNTRNNICTNNYNTNQIIVDCPPSYY
jgi:hypothetical protein